MNKALIFLASLVGSVAVNAKGGHQAADNTAAQGMSAQTKLHNIENAVDALINKAEKIKAGIRAKVEHPFRVIKCQFGHRKARYRGLAKNTNQLLVMFALSNLWMVRKRILQGAQA